MKTLTMVMALIVALAIGACGGDTTTTVIQEPDSATTIEESGEIIDTETTDLPGGSSTDLSEEANYITKADAICKAVNADIHTYPTDSPGYYRVLQKGTEDLDAIPVPASLETPVSQYLGAVYDMIDAQQNNDDRQAKEADRRKESAAQTVGFVICGTG